MVQVMTHRAGSDEREQLLRDKVRADRINDIVADVNSKRYSQYLRHVQNGFIGEPDSDPNDEYRDSEDRRAMVERVLDGYAMKHGVELDTGRIYVSDDFPIVAAPDAVEGNLIGITVHIRQSLHTYREAVERGVTADMYRHAQAMMAVSGLQFWLHINSFEDPEHGIRKLREHDVEFCANRAADLMESMIQFVAKSRFRTVDAA